MIPVFFEFFAGGGMARLGFGPNWTCSFANDIDPKKRDAYIQNFGREHFLLRDINDVTIDDLPPGRADCAWMSAPCVGHSEAGNREGFDEKQSRAFWPAWEKIATLDVQGRAPLTVVFENVIGIKPENLRAVQAAFDRAHYRHATRIVDAQHFLPQSRERYFVVGAHRDLDVDPEPLFEQAMRAMPERNIDLTDVLDLDAENCLWEFSPAEVERCLAMMSPLQRGRFEAALASGRPIAGPFSKRMRGPKGDRVQRVEFREGVASALRVASSGGSSKQFLIIAHAGGIRMRAIQPREAARLMGLPDSYILPGKPIEALDLCGDGVCVPVVRWLAQHVLEPVLGADVPVASGRIAWSSNATSAASTRSGAEDSRSPSSTSITTTPTAIFESNRSMLVARTYRLDAKQSSNSKSSSTILALTGEEAETPALSMKPALASRQRTQRGPARAEFNPEEGVNFMMRDTSNQTKAALPSEEELHEAAEAIVKGASSEPEPKPKSKRKTAKKAKEEHPPLPDETQPAQDLPKPKREAADYDLSSILADDSDEEEYTEALPNSAKITTKLPKSKFIQVRPGREHQLLVYAIKLDEEDQKQGQLSTFVLDKKMVPYFRDELEYAITKMVVREICTIQGTSFLYMCPASTNLSNNSFNTSRREVMNDGEKGWIIVRTDMEERKYKARKRKASLKPVKPMWSEEPIGERFIRSLGDMWIRDEEHPVVKRLNGEEEDEEE